MRRHGRSIRFWLAYAVVITLVFTICFSISTYFNVIQPYQRTKETVDVVSRAGGVCVVDEHGYKWLNKFGGSDFSENFGDIVEVDLRQRVRDFVLLQEEYSPGFFDEWIEKHLAHLSKLRRLRLAGLPITDRSVDVLLEFKELEELSVEFTFVSEEGYARLREGLPNCTVR